MHIALVYNEPSLDRYHSLDEGQAVVGILDSVRAVHQILVVEGHLVDLVPVGPPFGAASAVLSRLKVDLVFNLFEGFDGNANTEWMVAQELERLGVLFTGAASAILSLCLNKAVTKEALEAIGIPTPAYQVLGPGDLADFSLELPVVVKPLKEDASHGLTHHSLVGDLGALERQVGLVAERYGSPVLVEVFMSGREFNATVLGGQYPRVLPPTEIVYSLNYPGPRMLTYPAKWRVGDPAYQLATPECPARAPDEMCREISHLAQEAWRAVGAPPYARVDMRCDALEHLFVLEVNPNPDLSPQAGLALQAETAGLSYSLLIKTILKMALEERKSGELKPATHAIR